MRICSECFLSQLVSLPVLFVQLLCLRAVNSRVSLFLLFFFLLILIHLAYDVYFIPSAKKYSLGVIMKNLPEDFLNEMKVLLDKDEYERYAASTDKPYFRGIRVNTLKCTAEKLKALLPFELTPTPFCENGFYIPFETQGLGSLALHRAGAFYSQEPSAMSAVTILDVRKGDRVLDLCAAPGGKSTQIASALAGTGLLWSNEIVKNRANILLSNIERMGITNAVVSSCRPDRLCSALDSFFDKILVDAPCSGEGMFRRDDTAVSEWTAEHSRACAERQLAILESAALALKDGGTLVYSTCTFSYCENEGVIEKFLDKHGEFELIDCGAEFGRRTMDYAVRIFPEDGGEGHFAAKLRKKGTLTESGNSFYRINTPEINDVLKLYDEIMIDRPFGERFEIISDKVLLLPEAEIPALHGLGIIRAGLLFGEIRKNRIEPCHALFAAANPEMTRSFVNMSADDERLARYFHGEEIEIDNDLKGFTAVFADNISVGFGKAVNGTLKNRYPKGLRSLTR